MKRIVSVSLGSSSRDHSVETEILGEKFIIERIGTDGNMEKAIEMIRGLDGKVDAFGMGGIDLYICAGNKKYTIRSALPLKKAAKISPMVDGSGLKNTLERKVIKYLSENKIIDFKGKKVLIPSAMDRFGMAETLEKEGAILTIGDFIFALGIPIPLHSLKTLDVLARFIAPIACRLPFEVLYPTGKKQESNINKYSVYYYNNDIIAGDFLYIKRYMPEKLNDKIIITNTVTKEDVKILKDRGVKMLVTTTPELNGRSFGTNVMEGVLISLIGKKPEEIKPEDYSEMLDRIGFKPRIEYLNFGEV